MKTEIQWAIARDRQSSEQQGGFETRKQAQEQAAKIGYPYVVKETLVIGADDDVRDVERRYFRTV